MELHKIDWCTLKCAMTGKLIDALVEVEANDSKR
jgi:hypothetical protein